MGLPLILKDRSLGSHSVTLQLICEHINLVESNSKSLPIAVNKKRVKLILSSIMLYSTGESHLENLGLVLLSPF